VRALARLPLLFLVACPPPPAPPAVPGDLAVTGEKLATVDGLVVTQDMVDAITWRIPPDQFAQLKADPEQYKNMMDQIMFGQVLYKRALDEKVAEDPVVQRKVAMAVREVLAAQMIDQVGQKAVTEEAIKAAYDKHAVQFNRPSISLKHMIVKDKAMAEDVVASLKAGGNFADLAKAKSIDGGQNGGDLGWVERGRLIPELETPAFAAAKGDIVGPVETSHGFHVMAVGDVRQSTPLEDVREQLTEEVKREALNAYVEKVKGDMKVEWAGEASKETPTDAPAVPAPGSDGAAVLPAGH
jgi:peptidyl-prolyl cis-trans isomerase C